MFARTLRRAVATRAAPPPLPVVLLRGARDAERLARIAADPAAEAARHVVPRHVARTHRGLPLLERADEYPAAVRELHRRAVGSAPALHALETLLMSRGEAAAPEVALVLGRELARRDKLALMFGMLHKMRELGVRRDARLFRSLVFACCKFDDTDLALYAIECAFHDDVVDTPSIVRVFDAHTASADRRAWHVLDLVLLTAPGLHWMARANLVTAAMLNAAAHAARLGRSRRARRGFVTLPNPRGEWANPWRHTVGGIQTHTEVDSRTGQFSNPDLYTDAELEMQEIMLELDDGTRLRHHHFGTQSDAQRAAQALLNDAVDNGLLPPPLLDDLLRREGDDPTRADGFRTSNPRLGQGEPRPPRLQATQPHPSD